MEETREVHEVTSLQVDLLITELGAYYTYSNSKECNNLINVIIKTPSFILLHDMTCKRNGD